MAEKMKTLEELEFEYGREGIIKVVEKKDEKVNHSPVVELKYNRLLKRWE